MEATRRGRPLMEDNKIEDRREFRLYHTKLKAHYISEESKRGWEECTIINISREGMGIKFHSCEKINVGSTVHLEIFVPIKLEPINVKGILKWIEKWENDFIGGIKLTDILDDAKFSKLC